MKTGNITIKENDSQQFTVDIELTNGNLWLTKHEIARLFNVFVNTIENNLRSIFKSRILREEDACYIVSIQYADSPGNGYKLKYYNIEVLLSLSSRIASREAKAFRQWILKSLKDSKIKELNDYHIAKAIIKIPFDISLN